MPLPSIIALKAIQSSATLGRKGTGERVAQKAMTAETHDIALEGIEEHVIVKRLLKELESLYRSDEQWTAKLSVLKENVEHHVEQEEGEMFSKARKAFGKDEIQDLGARMEAAKMKGSNVAAA
jgi:DNA phosphorothioation-dependent restriction protein DptG